MEKYDSKLARLKAEIYKLQDEIEERESENEELRAQIKKLRKSSKHNPQEENGCENDCKCDHAQDCENQHDNAKEIDKEEKERNDENELQQVIDDMTEECVMQQDKIEKLEQELEESNSTIEKMKQQIQDLGITLKKYKQKIQSQEHSKAIEDLNLSIDEKENQIEEMEVEKQKLINRITELETYISEQDLELPVEDIEGVSPRSANSALRILKTQYLRLRNEHECITKENSQLLEENGLLKKELEGNCMSDTASEQSHSGHNKDKFDNNEQDEDGTEENEDQGSSKAQHDAIDEIPLGTNKIEQSIEDKTATLKKEYEKLVSHLQEELQQRKEEIDRLTIVKNEMTQERGTMMEYIHLVRIASSDLDKKNDEVTQNLQHVMTEKTELEQKIEALQLELKMKDGNRSYNLKNRVNVRVSDLVKFHESVVEQENTQDKENKETNPDRIEAHVDNNTMCDNRRSNSSPALKRKVYHYF